MRDGSTIVVGIVDHSTRLYSFSKFYSLVMLLMHANQENALWHEISRHFNYMYLYQLSREGIVTSLPKIQFCRVFHRCIMGKHLVENFKKGNTTREPSILELVHSDITGPYPQPLMSKMRYVLTFIDV